MSSALRPAALAGSLLRRSLLAARGSRGRCSGSGSQLPQLQPTCGSSAAAAQAAQGRRLRARAAGQRSRLHSLTPVAAATVSAPAPAPGAAAARDGGRAAAAPTFQQAVQRLQDFWASVGCAVWLPHNTEVGAGTMNPATFLRVLGPEPWNVCYAEPSVRPDDSRSGLNPNGVLRQTLFPGLRRARPACRQPLPPPTRRALDAAAQVILKPEPGNPQELFLRSLEALGIDTAAHDVRFVEDNWESPVWLDGMEVTQFTYFQQAGSLPLRPVAVEITYGLERILMALQGVDHFTKIRYSDSITYGEMFLQNEQEMSRYNLDVADVANQRSRFDLFDAEARAMVAQRLPLPAYDNLLKTSQAFNMLDVGVTERAELFARMRTLAREVSKLWLERREELGFPLLRPAPETPAGDGAGAGGYSGTLPTAAAPFVLELGGEELPAQDVSTGVEQLAAALPPLLERLRLAHGAISVGGTPRRLTATVEALAPMQGERRERVRGPPAKAARDAAGGWSKAAEGFARKAGVEPAALQVAPDEKGVEYVWADVQEAGRPAAEVLAAELPALVAALSFPRTMRWNGEATYSRPLRWLLALHGGATLRFGALGVVSGGSTRLTRKEAVPERAVADAGAYAGVLAAGGVMVDGGARRAAIWEGAQALAAAAGGRVPESARGELLDEVANLVEAPTPVAGAFDPAFLALPREVLVMVMRKHQRYFPVERTDGSGALLPAFVTVANGAVDAAVVRRGNEAVLRARYEDARFFYEADCAKRLEEFRPALSGTVFEKRLGSLLAKSERVEALVPRLAALLGLPAGGPEVAAASAAARLSRADLATAVVTEFTALAGTMGRHYAAREGLPPAVCDAIFESVLPRAAGDALPETPAGVLVACADRLDSLVGLFAVGGAPTAVADPFGLRRAAYGLVETLVARRLRVDLRAAVAEAAALQPVDAPEALRGEVLTFVARRLEQLLVDRGVAAVETVRAVLKEQPADPAAAAEAVAALAAEERGAGARYAAVLATFARPTRLVRGKEGAAAEVSAALFEADEERALFDALLAAEARLRAPGGRSVGELFAAAEALGAPVAAFFDKVLVMADDAAVRANRLALMRRVAALPAGLADLAELPGF